MAKPGFQSDFFSFSVYFTVSWSKMTTDTFDVLSFYYLKAA